jgi:hypothetical protein
MAHHNLNRHLTWRDFKRVDASPNPPYTAQTTPVVAYRAQTGLRRGKWHVREARVTLRLDPEETWVVRGHETRQLLAHEQGHYDVAVVAARMLQARLDRLESDSAEELDAAIHAAFAEIVGSEDGPASLQQQVTAMYEDDLNCGSNHGLEAHNQAAWSLRIRWAAGHRQATLNDLLACPRPQPAPRRRR